MTQIALAAITEPGSIIRPNEDAFFIWQDERYTILAVMDGVTQMLAFPTQAVLCQFQGSALTPGGFAAAITRATFARLFVAEPTIPLRAALTEANAAIRTRVIEVLGDCTLAAFIAHEPRLAPLRDDPRYIRPMLPATVVTLARLDHATSRLECAHLGDTALLRFRAGTAPVAVTHQPHRVVPDRAYTALRALPLDASYFPPAYAHLTPAMLTVDMAGRFYHNFVDAAGQTDATIGAGVLNGLPEMADYRRDYALDLLPEDEIVLCSDGFLWPHDPFTEQTLMRMHAAIATHTLAGYLAAVRASEDERAAADRGPRLKIHDDATALWLRYRPN